MHFFRVLTILSGKKKCNRNTLHSSWGWILAKMEAERSFETMVKKKS